MLIEAARDEHPVSGLTHSFYRYPARFSPRFVRRAIELFTKPGDWVLDPFMGGGTTLVEARSLGRQAIGVDISSLATFISKAKTTRYAESDLKAVKRWAKVAADRINMHEGNTGLSSGYWNAYLRNVGSRHTWRLRKCIDQALASAVRLTNARRETLARCVVLHSAQWALDGRSSGIPTVREFRHALVSNAHKITVGAREFREAVAGSSTIRLSDALCLHRSASGIEEDLRIQKLSAPSLVLTSPPYPGVHVLYHRWQVDGRKETPAPFWIANQQDGSGESYYTLGNRKATGLNSYFNNLRSSMKSIAAVCSKETLVIQIVAFSKPSWQLPRYLSVMDDAGMIEHFLPKIRDSEDGRLWRSVPNRKWHADQKGKTSGAIEVVLFHRLKSGL